MRAAAALLATFVVAAGAVAADLPIGTFADGSLDDWRLQLNPGCLGNLAVVEDASSPSGHAAGLEGAFSLGQEGYYLLMGKSVSPVPFKGLRFKVKTTDFNKLSVRLLDATGQYHQQIISLKDSAAWQTVEVRDYHPKFYYGKWGGANDGQWHDPLREVWLILERPYLNDDLKQGKAFFADIVLEK